MAWIGEDDGGQRVVEIIGPLRVHAVSLGLDGRDDGGIVEVGFGDEDEAAAEGGGEVVNVRGELLEKVDRGPVDDLVDGIEAKTVDVEVSHPHQGVVEKEAANFVGAAVFKVDGGTPGGVVFLRRVGTELAGVVADRAEVVVDDVEDDADRRGGGMRRRSASWRRDRRSAA